MQSYEINHAFLAIYEHQLYVFTLNLRNFCTNKGLIYPLNYNIHQDMQHICYTYS